MPEHLSNGQFAKKEVAEPQKERPQKVRGRNSGTFVKGDPRCGRPPGVPNKLTRDVKEFLAALVASTRVQEAVEQRIEKGDAVAFFRALEHVLGKPKEQSEVKHSGKVIVEWGGRD